MENIDETLIWTALKPLLNKLPSANEELLPGIKWGTYTQLYTPAFWKFQYMLSDYSTNVTAHRLAPTIIEEVVMCILGGYGIPSEIGIIAFNCLKEKDAITRNASFEKIYEVLSRPMQITMKKSIRYRFYNQKSKYIYKFLNRKDLDEIPLSNDIKLRSWLLTIDGIGLKTASWITRNWLKSDNVAIIDIHLFRAGKLTGFFSDRAISNYLKLEREYLAFCEALHVVASDMDAVIWGYMKKNTKLAGSVKQ
jgi:thermostable 8-oxoguanine DNA glycosylase